MGRSAYQLYTDTLSYTHVTGIDKTVTVRDIIRATGRERRSVNRCLKALIENGMAVRKSKREYTLLDALSLKCAMTASFEDASTPTTFSVDNSRSHDSLMNDDSFIQKMGQNEAEMLVLEPKNKGHDRNKYLMRLDSYKETYTDIRSSVRIFSIDSEISAKHTVSSTDPHTSVDGFCVLSVNESLSVREPEGGASCDFGDTCVQDLNPQNSSSMGSPFSLEETDYYHSYLEYIRTCQDKGWKTPNIKAIRTRYVEVVRAHGCIRHELAHEAIEKTDLAESTYKKKLSNKPLYALKIIDETMKEGWKRKKREEDSKTSMRLKDFVRGASGDSEQQEMRDIQSIRRDLELNASETTRAFLKSLIE